MFFPILGLHRIKSTIPSVGQAEFNIAGTYSWTVPDDVFSVCAVCIGGGGGGAGGDGRSGGGGGGLGWKNSIPVVPGQDYLVVVGNGANRRSGSGDSYFISNTIVKGGGGGTPTFTNPGGAAGTWTGDGGYNGGSGGTGNVFNNGAGRGGSAASFSGPGQNGLNQMNGPLVQAYGGAGNPTSLRGISGPSYGSTYRAGRFGAGAGGDPTSNNNYGQGGSGGVWIDWTPGNTFPSAVL